MGQRKRIPNLRELTIELSFPKLSTGEYIITSPPDERYNCIAWTAGDNERFWWPDPSEQAYWPNEIPKEETTDAFVQLFKNLGYKLCKSSRLKKGVEKVAIFVKPNNKPTHAAKQLPSGKWTSKLGGAQDIAHKLKDIAGDLYGTIAIIMERPITPQQ